jgi:hypothetical protein
MEAKPHAACSMQRPNDQTEGNNLDIGQVKEGLVSIPRRMMCHIECAKWMSQVEAGLEEQTHELSISTYTFYFKSQPVDDGLVSKPRRSYSKRD